MSSVQVLCPNGRRVTVKLPGPNTPLLYVLEQVCLKQSYNSSNHILKQGRNKIDLSSPFRFSGLSNNAKLELVESDITTATELKDVQLIVQTENGQRLSGTFSPSASLWSVLDYHGLLNSESIPSVVYMRQQINGVHSLRETTLKDLGLLSGRAIVRLITHQLSIEDQQEQEKEKERPEQIPSDISEKQTSSDMREEQVPSDITEETREEQVPSEEVREEQVPSDITEETREEKVPSEEVREEQVPSDITEETREEQVPSEEVREEEFLFPAHPISIFPHVDDNQPVATIEETQPMEIDFQQMLQEAWKEARSTVTASVSTRQEPMHRVYEEPCPRNPVIYHLDTVSVTPTTELQDNFFNVTVSDVIMMQQDLKRQVQTITDAPLATQSMRAEYTRSNSNYTQTIVRVILPDRWILQGCFNTKESMKALVTFIRQHLSNPSRKFHLYTTPPKEVLRSGRVTFEEAGFVPAANVHFAFNEDELTRGVTEGEGEGSILSSASIRDYNMTALEADMVAVRTRPPPPPHRSEVMETEESSGSGQPSFSGSGQSNSSQSGQSSSSGSGQKLPKWLKLGQK